ncbi:Uu.00g005050.m01.CDS01 [Anthostomella pinea]|uniref:Uu.00g005050.m01.CDS01 n=1 Tax=Anthostomella pinea TaxID=933095 RepID=A0AAI8YIV2_9PEZI|nr:Uu.00g005050.m01.CDS01 [Anthostomella pinea]
MTDFAAMKRTIAIIGLVAVVSSQSIPGIPDCAAHCIDHSRADWTNCAFGGYLCISFSQQLFTCFRWRSNPHPYGRSITGN